MPLEFRPPLPLPAAVATHAQRPSPARRESARGVSPRVDHHPPRPSAGRGGGIALGPPGGRVDELPAGLPGVPRPAALQEAPAHAQDPHLPRGVRQARPQRLRHPLHPRLHLCPGVAPRVGPPTHYWQCQPGAPGKGWEWVGLNARLLGCRDAWWAATGRM